MFAGLARSGPSQGQGRGGSRPHGRCEAAGQAQVPRLTWPRTPQSSGHRGALSTQPGASSSVEPARRAQPAPLGTAAARPSRHGGGPGAFASSSASSLGPNPARTSSRAGASQEAPAIPALTPQHNGPRADLACGTLPPIRRGSAAPGVHPCVHPCSRDARCGPPPALSCHPLNTAAPGELQPGSCGSQGCAQPSGWVSVLLPHVPVHAGTLPGPTVPRGTCLMPSPVHVEGAARDGSRQLEATHDSCWPRSLPLVDQLPPPLLSLPPSPRSPGSKMLLALPGHFAALPCSWAGTKAPGSALQCSRTRAPRVPP